MPEPTRGEPLTAVRARQLIGENIRRLADYQRTNGPLVLMENEALVMLERMGKCWLLLGLEPSPIHARLSASAPRGKPDEIYGRLKRVLRFLDGKIPPHLKGAARADLRAAMEMLAAARPAAPTEGGNRE